MWRKISIPASEGIGSTIASDEADRTKVEVEAGMLFVSIAEMVLGAGTEFATPSIAGDGVSMMPRYCGTILRFCRWRRDGTVEALVAEMSVCDD